MNKRKGDTRTYRNVKYWSTAKLQEIIDDPYHRGVDGHEYSDQIVEIRSTLYERLNRIDEKEQDEYIREYDAEHIKPIEPVSEEKMEEPIEVNYRAIKANESQKEILRAMLLLAFHKLNNDEPFYVNLTNYEAPGLPFYCSRIDEMYIDHHETLEKIKEELRR